MKMRSCITVLTTFLFLGLVLFLIPNAAAAPNSCIDCHKTLSPFIEVQMQFNQIRIQHLEKGVTCSLECHEDRIRQLATANYQQWSESVHALKGIACEVCHGGDPAQATKERAHAAIIQMTDPKSPVYYTNVPDTCGKCHSKELDNFQDSKHYQKLEALKLAPTCTTCHAPHTFTILNPVEFRNFCGNCHSVYKKVAPYDIPVKAEYLLVKANRLKFNIDIARQDIFWAEKNGTDVTQANTYVDRALQRLSILAPMWHEFNLTHFEDEVDSANEDAVKAGELVKPSPTPVRTPVETPGFIGLSGMIALLAAIAAVVYRQRKK